MSEKDNDQWVHGEFMLNRATGEIHHLPYQTDNCQVAEIQKQITAFSLKTLRDLPDTNLCHRCLTSKE